VSYVITETTLSLTITISKLESDKLVLKERISELQKDQLERDALIMANARGLIKLKARSSNGRLYGDLFGTGHGTARQRCRDLGLDPNCNKTCYNEMINFQTAKGGAE
jgi:hypothetical protein